MTLFLFGPVVLLGAVATRAAGLSADVAATVDGKPIYLQQVERLVQQTLGQRRLDAAAKAKLMRAAVQRLIDRRAIVVYLQARDEAASANEISAAISRLSKRLARVDKTLADYLKEKQLTEAALHDELCWQITWQHQLDKYLTDDNLQRYFEQHKRMFDGTRLQVAHILKKVKTDADRHRAAMEQLEQVRQDIVSGKLTFAAAARQYSDAPTAADGGMLGWIGRHGPMPPAFTKAAFELAVGDISPPVSSPVGIHLIKCRAERRGKKTWLDVRPELTAAVSKYVFQWLAKKARPTCQVRLNAAPKASKSGTTNM